MVSTVGFDRIDPVLIGREDGGWLAVSPANAPLHIGVAAWSADDARNRFVRELREWKALLDGPTEDGPKA